MDILKQLKEYRCSIGMPKDTLATITGFDRKNFQRWEGSVTVPSLFNVRIWTETLGFDLVLLRKHPPKDYRTWVKQQKQ